MPPNLADNDDAPSLNEWLATVPGIPAGWGVRDNGISILIGCEYSASERDEFRVRGFDAWSCDLKKSDGDPRWHIQGDIRDAINSRQWDAIILHVECTAMAVCGNRHYGYNMPRYGERVEAIGWTIGTVELALANAPCVAVENPSSVIFPILRDQFNADVQYIQPWQHGHPEQKKTGLALWGFPRLKETSNVREYMMTLPRNQRERIHFMAPSADRGHERSRAFHGISAAMADQWGNYLLNQPGRIPTDAKPLSNFHGSE